MIRKSYLLVGMLSASSTLLVAHCGKCVEDSCPDCSFVISNPGAKTVAAVNRTCTCKENCSCKKMNCSLCTSKKCPCLKGKSVMINLSNHITLKIGEKEVIKLPTKPSTGYHWQLQSNKMANRSPAATVKMLEIEYHGNVKPGAAGVQPIEITGVNPGSMNLTFEYRGPSSNAKTEKTEKYTITVIKK